MITEINSENLLIAEAAIRQLHARYIDAVWRKDIDSFRACFAEDAQWKIAGLHARGRTEIGELLEKLLSASDRVMMFAGLPILDIAPGSATGRIPITEYIKRLDGTALRTLGVYYDRYICQSQTSNGQWLFQVRHLNLSYRGAPDFSAPFLDCADYGPPPGMPGTDGSTVKR